MLVFKLIHVSIKGPPAVVSLPSNLTTGLSFTFRPVVKLEHSQTIADRILPETPLYPSWYDLLKWDVCVFEPVLLFQNFGIHIWNWGLLHCLMGRDWWAAAVDVLTTMSITLWHRVTTLGYTRYLIQRGVMDWWWQRVIICSGSYTIFPVGVKCRKGTGWKNTQNRIHWDDVM